MGFLVNNHSDIQLIHPTAFAHSYKWVLIVCLGLCFIAGVAEATIVDTQV